MPATDVVVDEFDENTQFEAKESSWSGDMMDNIVKVANKNQVGGALIPLIPLLL
ncbi:hypothetical protein [uncultured Nostoc sp.]|uniref:hypothetical protein n=1 Tax=uncultured Nostoc sp. TaxID=340711 RepID=UPI0035C9E17F